ncbi:MAG: universal stress protein [Bacteroidales bacterium]|nr:universal stress protein [Bacteroidales bacterium]MBN2820156.1 universal stress protein [Bacteroidales bacterium]
MASENRKILVPYDYTELSEYAVKYAVLIAKIVETELVLLHVIDELNEEAEHHKRLEEVAKAITAKYGVKVEVKIRAGVVHKVIKVVAETLDAFIVIMKAQPPRGTERFLRSRSIRVMSGAKIPFIVVQAPPKRLSFKKIVFPIDFRTENKEKLVWISTLSKYYTSKIYLYRSDINDYKVRNNAEFSKRFLEGKSIDYEIVGNKEKLPFAEATLNFAHEVDAQLIIIMLRKRFGLFSNLFGISEQKYISNKYKIPVMCINPKIELHRYGGFY